VLTADLLHLTVAAFWLGGLVGLGLVVRSAGRAGNGRPAPSGGRPVRPASATRTLPRSRVEVAAVALSRFSTLAAALVAVLGVAGVLLAWRILGSWSALVDTGYGQALLVKLGLVVAVLAVAGYNRFVVLPAIDTAPTAEAGWVRLRRAVSVEGGLLVAVLAVTGWLVNASPTLPTAAGDGGVAVAPAATPVEQTVPLGTGTVSARLTPATAGVNSLEFSVVDANGQPVQPVSDPEVSVTMPAAGVGPLTRPVSVTGPGAYQAVLDLPLSGQWVVTISVRTSEFEQPSARIEVDIP
jgi:copper transport protein